MRISNIEATNILAIKDINLTLKTAVSVFCGRNMSMKSSIYDTVGLAMAKKPMRAVVLKKDYDKLVHDGAKAGGGLVIVDNDPDQAFSFNMPKGEFKGPTLSESMQESMSIALEGQKFAKMDAKSRLMFLRKLTKISSSKSVIVPMLLVAAGCPKDNAEDVFKLIAAGDFDGAVKVTDKVDVEMLRKIDEVTAQLRAGFSEAEEYAKARALDAKRLWCATTGRKSHGKDVAETWEAELPDVPTGDAVALRQQVEQQDNAINTANQSLGAIQQAASQAKADAATRASLAEAPAKVKSLTEQLALAEKELAAYLPKVEALRERAKGNARVGLIHDMMRLIVGEPAANMTKERAIAHSIIMAAYEKEYGPLPDAGKVDAEAQAELPAHENGLTVLQNRVANLKRDLDAAVQAKGQYDALAPAEQPEDATQELAEVQALLDTAKAEKQRLMNLALDIESKARNRAEAAQKTVDARKHHIDIAQWLAIAEELAPNGIPGRLLAAALAPVNEMLEQAHADTGWKRVEIRDDMEIMVDGRLYDLESESSEWRTDAMIAQMVATKSGVKILALDRFDVLDMPGRAELFTWIDTLVQEGDIDSALLFGTLKELPAAGSLPDSFTAYWVADGGVQQVAAPAPQEAEAVAA